MNKETPPTLYPSPIPRGTPKMTRLLRRHGWEFMARAYSTPTLELDEGPGLKDEKEKWDDE